MNSNFKNQRRKAIKQISFSSIGLTLSSIQLNAKGIKNAKNQFKMKGKINHSVCKWCFSKIPLEEFAVKVKAMGITGIDLIGPDHWHILKKYGLISSMCNGAEISLTEGWNDKKYHRTLVDNYLKHIDMVSDAGFKNLNCFSGNRRNIDDEKGQVNCAEGLKKIIGHAEKKGVIIQMELLNSKVDHNDYMCDNTNWGFELCRKIGSENFKLLFDIYHLSLIHI